MDCVVFGVQSNFRSFALSAIEVDCTNENGRLKMKTVVSVKFGYLGLIPSPSHVRFNLSFIYFDAASANRISNADSY